VEGHQTVLQAHEITELVRQRILASGAPVLNVMTHLDPVIPTQATT
jgi:divalent metal cation (Fe/Co/Zn/Cd) transporter